MGERQLPSKDFEFGGRTLFQELVDYGNGDYAVELWDNDGGFDQAELLYASDFATYEEALAEYYRVDSDPAAFV